MSSGCSNAGLKMPTPLFDRFVNDRLLEVFPLFDQAWLQLIRVTTSVAVDTLLQFLPKYGSLPDSGQDSWQATLLLIFDLLPKIACCFNLFTLNVYAN